MENHWKVLVAALALVLAAVAVWEALHGRWVLAASILMAFVTYFLAPKVEAALEPGPHSRAKPSIWRPLKDYIWAFLAFWVALFLFVFIRDHVLQ